MTSANTSAAASGSSGICGAGFSGGGREIATVHFGVPSRNGNYCTLRPLGWCDVAAEGPEAASGDTLVGAPDIARKVIWFQPSADMG